MLHRNVGTHPTNCKILKLLVCILLRVIGQVQGFRLTQHWFEYLFSNRYMFRSYLIFRPEDGHKTETSGSGFPSNATLV
jgi:hypothetical protein